MAVYNLQGFWFVGAPHLQLIPNSHDNQFLLKVRPHFWFWHTGYFWIIYGICYSNPLCYVDDAIHGRISHATSSQARQQSSMTPMSQGFEVEQEPDDDSACKFFHNLIETN